MNVDLKVYKNLQTTTGIPAQEIEFKHAMNTIRFLTGIATAFNETIGVDVNPNLPKRRIYVNVPTADTTLSPVKGNINFYLNSTLVGFLPVGEQNAQKFYPVSVVGNYYSANPTQIPTYQLTSIIPGAIIGGGGFIINSIENMIRWLIDSAEYIMMPIRMDNLVCDRIEFQLEGILSDTGFDTKSKSSMLLVVQSEK